jgi:hypothetical protein
VGLKGEAMAIESIGNKRHGVIRVAWSIYYLYLLFIIG